MKSGGDVFKGFEEGIPQFDPTYRFDAGTDVYDSRCAKKTREFLFYSLI